MSEKEDNKLETLRSKLNAKTANSGTQFLDIQKTTEGQYQMVVSMEPNEVSNKFLGGAPAVNKMVVRGRDYEEGSILSRIHQQEKIKDLQLRLEAGYLKDKLNNPNREVSRLDTRYRDGLSNSYLDLRGKTAAETEAINLYSRSEDEYYNTGIYGTTIDLLSNFASTGYYNEINNQEIKEFYDSWVRDVGFLPIVKEIFHNLFRYGVAYVLPSYSTYEPHFEGVSSIPGKEPNSKTRVGLKASVGYVINEFVRKVTGKDMNFNKFSNKYDIVEKGAKIGSSIPVAYSILDPKYISLTPAGFFNKYTVTIKKEGMKSLKAMIEAKKKGDAVSKSAESVLRMLPSGMRKAAEEDKDYTFADDEINIIFFRKNDFEAYAKPRGSRAFDSFDYKDELKKADFATVDGIFNYILKVTVGDKDNPVTDTSILESLAEAFNTPQKAFTIVWNHTLHIEKITTNEVGSILGKAKYEPVDQDILAALGMARALIDGTSLSGDAANLAVKAVKSEIKAAREQVEVWIYREYKRLAKASGFTTYPFVRWKETVISTDSDAVTRASYMQMLDRKAISIQSYMREEGLDYETERTRMEEELPLIQQGILQSGNPFQQTNTSSPVAQVKQSPDAGRPKGQPTGEKDGVDKIKTVKRKTKVTSPSQQASEETREEDLIKDLAKVLNSLDKKSKKKIMKSLEEDGIVIDQENSSTTSKEEVEVVESSSSVDEDRTEEV